MEVNLTLSLDEVNLVLQTLDAKLQNTAEFALISKIKGQGEPQLAALIEKADETSNDPEPV